MPISIFTSSSMRGGAGYVIAKNIFTVPLHISLVTNYCSLRAASQISVIDLTTDHHLDVKHCESSKQTSYGNCSRFFVTSIVRRGYLNLNLKIKIREIICPQTLVLYSTYNDTIILIRMQNFTDALRSLTSYSTNGNSPLIFWNQYKDVFVRSHA